MYLYKPIILVVIAAVLGSCNSLFNTDSSTNLDFELLATESPEQATTFNGDSLVFTPDQYRVPDDYPEFSSSVEDQQIVINGYYLAPSGFIPEGSAEKDNHTITILIKRPEHIDTVPNLSQGCFYDAYLSGLSEGTYTVQIVHRNDLMRGEFADKDTVFTREFTIK